MTLDQRPLIAIWETTRACDVACLPRRSSYQRERDALELDTQEARALLQSFAQQGVPSVVLTGADPAKRDDLVELVAFGRSLGLEMALSPLATPPAPPALMTGLARAGLCVLAVGVDGADAAAHDVFRGTPGSFERAERLLAEADGIGIRTQIDTHVHAANVEQLRAVARFVEQAGARAWNVLFMVPGKKAVDLPSAERVESCLSELASIAERAPFSVSTTAAPHYQRVLLEKHGKARTPNPAESALNDGRGVVFVSHRGDIYPSAELPRGCGNVRSADAVEVYRNHPVFRSLRDSGELTGKCGACEYRSGCGGSRARSFALSGSLFAADPLCSYVPPGYAADGGVQRSSLRVLP